MTATGATRRAVKSDEPAADDDARVANRFTAGRLPLICVLIVQTALSVRLVNSAFLNEATYLYAGHREIAWLLHGAPLPQKYPTYFSGAPALYPVLGAMADSVAGLRGARILDLAFALGATALLYSTTDRLFGRRAAFFAAVLFATSAPILFVGQLATYDAPAVFLLAWAFRTAVRSGERRAYVADACLYAVFAVVTKYAALAFVPVLIGVAFAVALPRVGLKGAVKRAVVMVALTSLLIVVALVLAGPSYLAGVTSTTTARAQSTDSAGSVAGHAFLYGGAIFVLAVVGTLLYAARTGGGPDAGDRKTRLLLGVVLTGAALIAPASQMNLHILTSLQKHVGYGLLFTAPIAGLALARLAAAVRWRTGLALAVAAAVGAAGVQQSSVLMTAWPNTDLMMTALRAQAADDRAQGITDHILAEDGDIPRYYLAEDNHRVQVTDTYSFAYLKHGKKLTGTDSYAAAIRDHYFTIIVLDFGPTIALDRQLASASTESGYHQIAKIPYRASNGSGFIYVWRFVPSGKAGKP